MERGKQVKLKGGKSMHTSGLCQRKLFISLWRLEDLKMEANEKMVLAGISHWDRAGVICMLNRVCMQLLNAHMLMKKQQLASFNNAHKA